MDRQVSKNVVFKKSRKITFTRYISHLFTFVKMMTSKKWQENCNNVPTSHQRIHVERKSQLSYHFCTILCLKNPPLDIREPKLMFMLIAYIHLQILYFCRLLKGQPHKNFDFRFLSDNISSGAFQQMNNKPEVRNFVRLAL